MSQLVFWQPGDNSKEIDRKNNNNNGDRNPVSIYLRLYWNLEANASGFQESRM